MTWDSVRRAYYFGCECSPNLTYQEKLLAGCFAAIDPDQNFIDRYCAPCWQMQTKNTPRRYPGTATRLHGVPISVARCVISKLAELVPTADHATPGWDWPDDMLPVVAVGRLDKAKRIMDPTIGVWAKDGNLFFWAKAKILDDLVQRHEINLDEWFPYRENDESNINRYYYDKPMACDCKNDNGPALPVPVQTVIQRFASNTRFTQPAYNWPDSPLSPREVRGLRTTNTGASGTNQGLNDPDEIADDPDEEATVDLPAGDDPDPNDAGAPSGTGDAEAEIKHKLSTSPRQEGMLKILRGVLIDRIRTVCPVFNDQNLDDLILDTGYPHADAAQPGTNIQHLVFVMAASIANAAGGRPDWRDFAPATVVAMTHGGVFANGGLTYFTEAGLASWFVHTIPAIGLTQRMARFHQSATYISGGNQHLAVALDYSLIRALTHLCAWLQNHYQGNPQTLHQAMAQTTQQANTALQMIASLAQPGTGVGIAVAANFLKDSQVPPLVNLYINPRSMATPVAGWIAKPDLHVLRFMAKLTRGVPLHIFGRRQSLRVSLTSFGNDPVAGSGFPQHYAAPGPLEYRAIQDIHKWAASVKTSPLEIERVIYLIGARKIDVRTASGTATISAAWYRRAEHAIDAALGRGVQPMS
jgi:hypothetical protein